MKRVCAVIVTYNPDIKLLLKNIYSISDQVKKIYIIDNYSNNIAEIKKYICNNDKICIFCNEKNYGIATALNTGFELAKSDNYEWALTLDQDSVCSEGLVKEFFPFMDHEKVGIICPLIDYKNYYRKKDHTGNEFDYIDACMTSGSLTNVEAWKQVGGFDEWMFIDYVDNDFCTNLRLNGYKIIRVNSAILHHELGRAEKKNIGFCQVVVFNYSKIRNYYYVRNTIYYIKKYSFSINVSKHILILAYTELKKILFESNRIETISSFMKGLIDGIKS